MKLLKPSLILIAISLALPRILHAQAITMTEFDNGLYDTGLGDANSGNNAATLSGGSSDTHYVVVSAPVTLGDALVVHQANLPGGWVANSTGTPPSRWDSTSATAGTQPPGTYDYQLTLKGITANSLVTITGNIAADNRVNILANGVLEFSLTTNASYAASFTPFSFSFNSSLVSTSDTLDFDVINTGATNSTTGLQVQGLAGTYTPLPEPRDSAALLILGAVALGVFRKLRKRSSAV